MAQLQQRRWWQEMEWQLRMDRGADGLSSAALPREPGRRISHSSKCLHMPAA